MVYDDSLSTSSLIIIVKLTKRRKKHHYKLLISLNSILFPGTMYCFWSLSGSTTKVKLMRSTHALEQENLKKKFEFFNFS